MHIVKYHDMDRAAFIEKLIQVQQTVEQLLGGLHLKFPDRRELWALRASFANWEHLLLIGD